MVSKRISHICEVINAVVSGEELNRAIKIVSEKNGINASTVKSQCTRELESSAEKFKNLLKDYCGGKKGDLITVVQQHVSKNSINEDLDHISQKL